MPDMNVNGSARPHTTLLVVVLSIGTLFFFLASATVVSAQDGAGEDNLPRYWEIHAWLLTFATAFFVTSYLALWLKFLSKLEGVGLPALATRVSRLWYKLHMYFGAIGVVLAIAGAIWGYLIVQWAYGGPHLRIAHSYVGLVTGLVALAPLITGFAARAVRKGRYTVRWWHLAIGLMGIALMLAGTISGWSLE